MRKNPSIFVISSPSGGGKTTIRGILLKTCSGLKGSVSLTTRESRKNERDKRDYYFVKQEEFLEKIKQNAFAEWAKVLDNYYGTLKENIEIPLKKGQDVILTIDVQGALRIKKLYPRAVLIYILPFSLNVLKKRLKNRETDTKADIEKRIKLAVKELEFVKKYDYAVVNDSLIRAAGKVKSIIMAQRCRVCNNYKEVKKI